MCIRDRSIREAKRDYARLTWRASCMIDRALKKQKAVGQILCFSPDPQILQNHRDHDNPSNDVEDVVITHSKLQSRVEQQETGGPVKSVALQMRNKRNKRITARRFVHARSDSN